MNAISRESLKQLRADLDGLDAQLVGLLLARVELVRGIGTVKRACGMPAKDEAREREVVDGAVGLARETLADERACALVRSVMTNLVEQCREEVAQVLL